MKNAKPRDFTFDAGQGRLQAGQGKPGAGAPAAARERHGCVVDRRRRHPQGDRPGVVHARRVDYICSGSVVKELTDEQAHSIVLTAGHCATRERRRDQGDQLAVHPRRSTPPRRTPCGQTTYGCWVADAVYVRHGVRSRRRVQQPRPSARLGVRGRGHGRQVRATLSSTRPSASGSRSRFVRRLDGNRSAPSAIRRPASTTATT